MTELKLKKLVQAVAYFAIIFLAVALLLKVLDWQILNSVAAILTQIANLVSYIIMAILAFFYVKTKRNILYMVSYIVAVVAVVIFLIIPLF